MRRIYFAIFASIALFGTALAADQYQNIPPGLKCHFSRKDRSFCKVFPNFSRKHGICNPDPTYLGNIVWCREDITVTEQDECGKWDTYDAVVITYREVYSNGAWGKKFKKTFRKDPIVVTPPVIYK